MVWLNTGTKYEKERKIKKRKRKERKEEGRWTRYCSLKKMKKEWIIRERSMMRLMKTIK